MSQRTAFLGKLVGLYCILYALSAFARRQATVDEIIALVNNPAALLVLALIVLGAGLAMVIGHNVWSGGALPVVVTIVGWLTLIKGLFLLLLSPSSAASYLSAMHYDRLLYLYAGIALVLGAYLTYGGFGTARKA